MAKSMTISKKRYDRLGTVRSRLLDPELVKQMVADGRLRPVNDPSRVMRFVASTQSVDRMGDVVMQDWDFSGFVKNPVILWNHDQNIPIGRSVGEEVITDENDDVFKEVGPHLVLYVEFASAQHGDHVEPIFKMYRDGFLTGGSVGFAPIEVDECRDDLRRKEYGLGPEGVVFVRNELAEFTLCTVPANRDVVVTGMKSLSAGERLVMRRLLLRTPSKPPIKPSDKPKTPAAKPLRLKMATLRDGFLLVGRSDQGTMAFGEWHDALTRVGSEFDALQQTLEAAKDKADEAPEGSLTEGYADSILKSIDAVQKAKGAIKDVEGKVKGPESLDAPTLSALELQLKSVYDIGIALAEEPAAASMDLTRLSAAFEAHNAAYGEFVKTLTKTARGLQRRAGMGEGGEKPPSVTEAVDATSECEILEDLIEEVIQNYDVPEQVAEDLLTALEALEIKLGIEPEEPEEAGAGEPKPPKPKSKPAPKAESRMFRDKPKARHYAGILERGGKP